MTSGWHYWLFEAEEGRLPLPVEGVDPKVFTSLEEAREAAGSVGRAVDIFRTPWEGGIAEFVETVVRDVTVTPAIIELKAEVHSPPVSTTTDKVEPAPTFTREFRPVECFNGLVDEFSVPASLSTAISARHVTGGMVCHVAPLLGAAVMHENTILSRASPGLVWSPDPPAG